MSSEFDLALEAFYPDINAALNWVGWVWWKTVIMGLKMAVFRAPVGHPVLGWRGERHAGSACEVRAPLVIPGIGRTPGLTLWGHEWKKVIFALTKCAPCVCAANLVTSVILRKHLIEK